MKILNLSVLKMRVLLSPLSVVEFSIFEHGIGASPGSLKIKEAEGKEFFVPAASPAV